MLAMCAFIAIATLLGATTAAMDADEEQARKDKLDRDTAEALQHQKRLMDSYFR